MKRYLWTAVAVLFVNANASENPFALKENLLKIDNDQEMLLLELRKIAEAREDAELEADDDEMDAELEKEANAKEAPSRKGSTEGKASEIDSALDAEDNEMDAELAKEANAEANAKVAPGTQEYSEEQAALVNSIDDIVGDNDKGESKELVATTKVTEDMTQKEEALSNEAEKSAKLQAAEKAKREFEAALKVSQEKEAAAKAKLAEDARETERREVAAYEKQRAEKLAKQAEADAKKKAEQAADIDVEAEKKAAKEMADTGYKDAVKEMGGSETIVTSKSTVEKTEMVEEKSVGKAAVADGDIDPEAEKAAAKDAADAAYLEAIREMDQED